MRPSPLSYSKNDIKTNLFFDDANGVQQSLVLDSAESAVVYCDTVYPTQTVRWFRAPCRNSLWAGIGDCSHKIGEAFPRYYGVE